MTGIISKGVKNNESLENLRAFSFYVNSIIVGFVVPIAYVLTKNEILFSLFLSDDF